MNTVFIVLIVNDISHIIIAQYVQYNFKLLNIIANR